MVTEDLSRVFMSESLPWHIPRQRCLRRGLSTSVPDSPLKMEAIIARRCLWESERDTTDQSEGVWSSIEALDKASLVPYLVFPSSFPSIFLALCLLIFSLVLLLQPSFEWWSSTNTLVAWRPMQHLTLPYASSSWWWKTLWCRRLPLSALRRGHLQVVDRVKQARLGLHNLVLTMEVTSCHHNALKALLWAQEAHQASQEIDHWTSVRCEDNTTQVFQVFSQFA